MLDAVADSLEAKGLIKEAYEIDKIADKLDKKCPGCGSPVDNNDLQCMQCDLKKPKEGWEDSGSWKSELQHLQHSIRTPSKNKISSVGILEHLEEYSDNIKHLRVENPEYFSTMSEDTHENITTLMKDPTRVRWMMDDPEKPGVFYFCTSVYDAKELQNALSKEGVKTTIVS